MHLNIQKRKDGRTYLSICKQYRDPQTKKRRSSTIKSLGFVDELQNEFDDPIKHFTKIAKEMTEKRTVTVTFDTTDEIEKNNSKSKNFGYLALSKIYHNLDIDNFFKSRQRKYNIEYNLNSIFKLIVYERILSPGSKISAFNNKDKYFDLTDFSLQNIYRSLSIFNNHKEELQLWLHNKIQQQYNRKTDLVYYDVTNYYFEIDNEDALRKKGHSKENKKTPIVQLGLFTDTKGIPISYKLFEGNTHDALTLRDMLSNVKVKNDYNLGRIIVVADKGINSGDNIYYLKSANQGYVLSSSVKKSNAGFKEYVFNQEGYKTIYNKKDNSISFKHKSRLSPRTINVTSTSGKKIKKVIDEKQLIFYSEKYAKRSKAKREEAIKKAYKIINNPGVYNKSSTSGARKYIKNIKFDKKSGEILEPSSSLTFDEEKMKEEEKYDGYYAIFTSEMEMTNEEIISTYKGLWKIEESFKITKSDLESRPVYVSRKEHIEAHFLTCFVSLIILRLIQLELENEYSIGRVINSMKKSTCCNYSENLYFFNYYDDILEKLGKKLNITFKYKILNLRQIKKIINNTKIN